MKKKIAFAITLYFIIEAVYSYITGEYLKSIASVCLGYVFSELHEAIDN